MAKAIVQNNPPKTRILFWSDFNCEICFQKLPFQIKTENGKKFTLIEHDLTEE